MDESKQTTDEHLFASFRDGDETALATLFERHRGRVAGMLGRRVPNGLRRRVSVSDVLQEVELAVFRRQSVFEDRGAGSFRRWYFAIAENKLREELRRHGGVQKRAAHNEVSRGGRPETGQFHGAAPSPSQVAIASEFRAQIETVLATLSADHRRVLELTRLSGMTLAEAARELGRTREATKKLYGRAFVRFQAAYRERFGASPDGGDSQTTG